MCLQHPLTRKISGSLSPSSRWNLEGRQILPEHQTRGPDIPAPYLLKESFLGLIQVLFVLGLHTVLTGLVFQLTAEVLVEAVER